MKILSVSKTVDFKYDNKAYEAIVVRGTVKVDEVGEIREDYMQIAGGDQSHMCGLQGYDPMKGDNCPACDDSHYKSTLLRTLRDKLTEEGILEKKIK